MNKLVWLETARADLLNIIDYISDDNLAAAQRVKDDIEEKTAKLISFPAMGREGRVNGTRELVVHASYVVVYQTDIAGIRILRVLHTAQAWPPQG